MGQYKKSVDTHVGMVLEVDKKERVDEKVLEENSLNLVRDINLHQEAE